jgi:hypothetical protein
MLQRGLAWTLLAILVILTIHGVLAYRLFDQDVWHPGAVTRLLIVAGIYFVFTALMVWLAPRWWLPSLGGLTFLYTALAVGLLPPLAIAYLALAFYATGSLWLKRMPALVQRNPQLAILLGLSVWMTLVAATARWPIHYRPIYWILPAVPVVYALRKQHFPDFQLEYPKERRDLIPLSIGLFPLFCHWLIALKPEVSSDGLAMHMVIPARMAYAHHWNFDVHEFAWAVMPMGGDWAYSIAWQLAGEACARLLNFAVLGLIAWILMERLHARVPMWIASLLAGAFLATPLTQHVSGSMFVENFVAAFLLGSVLMLRFYMKENRGAVFYACAFLAGAAVGSKFGALAFVIPLLIAACLKVRFRHLLFGLPIVVLVGGLPYFEAWMRTSNPTYPFFNAVFHSPFYESTQNFRDIRFSTPLSGKTWYDLTFQSHKYLEGQDGSFGFLFFLLLPLAFLGVRKRWPRTGFVLLWVVAAGSLISFAGQSNIRYLYPALPLATLLIGIAAASFRTYSPKLGDAIGAVAGAALLLNLSFLPAAGWYQKDFALNQVLNRASVDDYLAFSAPERKLVDYLNQHDPKARVAWLEGNAIADFHGYPVTNSWHSDTFYRRLRQSTAPEGHAWLAQDFQIDYFIAPSPSSPRPLTNVYTREFLDLFTVPVLSFAGMDLRKKASGDIRKQFAPPGKYDELGPYTSFSGQWTRDLQFTNAFHGTLVYSNDTRSRALIRFKGAAIRLIYTAAANRCTGLVSIDEGAESQLNEYSAETRWQALSPLYSAPGPGEHLLQLRFPQGRTKSAIGGCYLDIDGFIVE